LKIFKSFLISVVSTALELFNKIFLKEAQWADISALQWVLDNSLRAFFFLHLFRLSAIIEGKICEKGSRTTSYLSTSSEKAEGIHSLAFYAV